MGLGNSSETLNYKEQLKIKNLNKSDTTEQNDQFKYISRKHLQVIQLEVFTEHEMHRPAQS